MLKPLIIIAQDSFAFARQKDSFLKHFIETGFYPILCGYDYSEVSKHKEHAEYILAMLPNQISGDARMTLFYLRDICIDEEKVVFLCGEKKVLGEAKKIIPSIMLQGAYETTPEDIGYVANEMKKSFGGNFNRPGCLLIDPDIEYCRKLRLALSECCDVAYSSGVENITQYIEHAQLLVISIDMKIDFLEWALLTQYILDNKKREDFHMVLLAKDYMRQNKITKAMSVSGVCLSKQTDFLKNAKFLKTNYFNKM